MADTSEIYQYLAGAEKDKRVLLGFDQYIERLIGTDNAVSDTGLPTPTTVSGATDLLTATQGSSLPGTGSNPVATGSETKDGTVSFEQTTFDMFDPNQDMQTRNFVSGSTGWRIKGNGDVEFNNGTFRGALSASTIDIGGADATSFHVDINGNLWSGAGTYAAAPFKVSNTGVVVASSITATGTINATGGYVGSTTALIYESQGINTGITGHIRGGQTDYHTGTGYFLGYAGGAYKLSIGNPAAKYITWDGADLTINGYIVSGKGAFGGDGSDGALSINAGTTNIDCGAAAIVVKNYTSISITGTGKLTFSNPHANGTVIILKSQGAVVLTSGTVPAIDVSSLGSAYNTNGQSYVYRTKTGNIGGNGVATAPGTGGAGGAAVTAIGYYESSITGKNIRYACGAGGGKGGTGGHGGGGGNGGNGGGVLIIESYGALNFACTINANGAVGSNGTTAAQGGGGGGGGGGAGGTIALIYNSLTANTGTLNVVGGDGGTGGNGVDHVHFDGGGGGGAGGTNRVDNAGAGGAGGTGGAVGSNGIAGTADYSAGGALGAGGNFGGVSGGGGGGGGGSGGVAYVTENTQFA